MQVARNITDTVLESIKNNPVTAIIGARQVGKSTLAKQILSKFNPTLFIDLEKPSDKALLSEPQLFLEQHREKLICLDEIQLIPEIFSVIRSFVDDNPKARFLILGSSSPNLLRQTSESLAGRIAYLSLAPFSLNELGKLTTLKKYCLLGGFPRSILSKSSQQSFSWLSNFTRTFLERDLQTFGFNIPPETLRRLWVMIAHLNGQMANYSQIGNSLGLSHTTIKHYIDILHHTFMLRVLSPYYINIKKRLIKSPKLYIRDTGILHSLLNIKSFEELYAHPVYGSSWESTVIENILSKFKEWDYFYYRTAKGVELDLVLTKANRVIAIEIKASPAPKLTKGFYTALQDVNATEAYVIAPVAMAYPLKNNVMVYNLLDFLELNIEE